MTLGPWIQANGQNYIDILNPTVEQFRAVGVRGFARCLSRLNRYTGWVGEFSVAQHSVNVARCTRDVLGREDLFLPALWHDAPEAGTGDLSTPLKKAIDKLHPGARQAIAEITWRWERTFEEAFGIPKVDPNEHDIIKQADLMCLRGEREYFMSRIDSNPEREADWATAWRGLPAYTGWLHTTEPSAAEQSFFMSHLRYNDPHSFL